MANMMATPDRHEGSLETFLSAARKLLDTTWQKTGVFWQKSRNRLSIRNFSTPDVERICRTLDVENRGMTDGVSERPEATDRVASGAQREILNHFEIMVDKARERLTRTFAKLRKFSANIDVAEFKAEIEDIPARCENEILRYLANRGDRLGIAHAEAVDAPEDNESASASVDDSDPSSLSYALGAIFLVFGGAMAITVVPALGAGTAQIVPTSWAVALQIVAVVVPLVLTREVLRGAEGESSFQQLFTRIALFAVVLFVAFLAAFTTHYVTAVSAGTVPDIWAVFEALKVVPIAADLDFSAKAAAGVVMMTGLAAMLMGNRSVKTHNRSRADAKSGSSTSTEVSERVLAPTRDRINKIVDAHERKLNAAQRKLKRGIRRYGNMIDKAKEMPERLAGHEKALEDACNAVLDRYRAANRRARKSAEPDSFSELANIAGGGHDFSADIKVHEEQQKDLRRRIESIETDLVQLRQRLRDLNWRAINAAENGSVSW